MDMRAARNSRSIEELGFYDPLERDDERQVFFRADRVRYWLSVGAQPSDTVRALLKRVGIDPTPGQKYEPAEGDQGAVLAGGAQTTVSTDADDAPEVAPPTDAGPEARDADADPGA